VVAQQPAGGDPGHGMGIASLVTSILGLGLVGVVLGIIAMNKSKKAGHKNTLGLVGVIIGSISIVAGLAFMVIVLAGFGATKDAAVGFRDDTLAVTRANSLHAKLEEYYNEKNSYPKNISAAEFPGIDATALQDIDGVDIEVSGGTAKTKVEAAATPESSKYQYIPFGCTGNACLGYILRVDIENASGSLTDPYVKNGLMNP
jgi:hypothetical protein